MFRSVAFVIILLTASFTGCTDSTPNRTIVTFQIDSDGEDYWIYLYSVPRIKMGNFTIITSLGTDTVSSVYSYQKQVSFDNMTKDEEDYVYFTFQVDLSEVFWELECKLRLSSDSTDGTVILDAINLNNDQEVSEWKLPYSAPLNYS